MVAIIWIQVNTFSYWSKLREHRHNFSLIDKLATANATSYLHGFYYRSSSVLNCDECRTKSFVFRKGRKVPDGRLLYGKAPFIDADDLTSTCYPADVNQTCSISVPRL